MRFVKHLLSIITWNTVVYCTLLDLNSPKGYITFFIEVFAM